MAPNAQGCYRGTGADNRVGAPWQVLILPYIEQTALHQQLNFSSPGGIGPFNSYANLGVQTPNTLLCEAQPLSVYKCPSFPNWPPPWFTTGVGTNQKYVRLVNNYFGCMGGGVISTAAGANADACYMQNQPLGWITVFRNGLLGVNTRNGFKDCTDGTSNVVMVGESTAQLEVQRSWFNGYRTNHTSNNNPANLTGTAGAINGQKAHYLAGRAIGGSNHNAIITLFFGSEHPGGAFFLMGDGSVHFISQSINLAVYQRLGPMNDGLPVGGFTP
jgi:hypothetical protein